jgi:large subunit ribosomal protein L16
MPPKRTKYRKSMKIHSNNKYSSSSSLMNLGSVAIKSLENVILTEKQINATRLVINRYIKKIGTSYCRVFPDMPISKKPLEVRMGGGKGSVDHYATSISPGKIIFEISNVPYDVAQNALIAASHKLPVRCKISKRKFTY